MAQTQEKNKNNNQLTPDFILELFANILTSDRILDTVIPHLQFQFLPTNAHKELYKYITDFYNLNKKIPTYGIISETYKTNAELNSLLAQVKEVNIHDNNTHEQLLEKFEEFLKRYMFLELHSKTTKLWNENKTTEAVTIMAEGSQKINEFTIKQKYYKGVFGNYKERQLSRQNRESSIDRKICYGIHELDFFTRGGGKTGTSCLILARSGVGKTTFLRWIGITAALMGKRVVHFQAEGSEEDCFDGYDAAWTGQKTVDLEDGVEPNPSVYKIANQVYGDGGEIHIFASEQFDSMPIENCRERIIQIEKMYGKVDLVLYDYLELFTVGSGKQEASQYGERNKRDTLGKKITNMAIELDHHAVAATQTNDISPDFWNDPAKVLTKNNIAEHKGLVRHFATFLTLNQTLEEYDNSMMRIYIDKLRKYKGGQIIPIVQSPDLGRFYNAKSTLKLFWDDSMKRRANVSFEEQT